MLTRPVLILPLLAAAAHAAVVEFELPACKPAPGQVAIDGRLDEWRGVAAQAYRPLLAGAGAALAHDRPDLAAELRTAYDGGNLYLAVAWKSPLPPANRAGGADGWQLDGDGLALHLACDGLVVHVVSLPGADGKGVRQFIRRDGERAWRDLAGAGGAGAMAIDGAGWNQELAIPWSALARSGEPQFAAPMRAMIDLAWQAMPTSELAKVNVHMRRDAMHFSYNVLNSRPRLLSRNYLRSPGDWGDLAIAQTPQGARREDTPLGGGITALTVGRPATDLAIDGTLADGEWPVAALSDHAYASDFLGDRYGIRVGMLADESNLYLAARLASPIRPINTEPEQTQQGFRGGDCLQLRLARGNRVVNLCAWYDSVNGRVALTADGKDVAHPFLLTRGARAAAGFGDGSYTLELALPWSELFPGAAPALGEHLRATLQPWWVGADPRFTLSTQLVLEKRLPLAYAYTMPRDAEVTLGVYDAGGLRRWLTRSAFRRAGANTEYWDGRDQDGRPLAAGTYEIRALYHDPLGLVHALSVGNPGNPPWSTQDGSGDWVGDESNIQAAASDGDWVFLASPCSEKGFTIIGVDGSGQRRWGIGNEICPRSVALAVHGDHLYAMYCGPEKTDTQHVFSGRNGENRVILRCYDKRTGEPARFTRSHPSLKVATWPYRPKLVGLWEFFNARSFDPESYGGLPRYGDCQYGEAVECMGVAATAETVYVSFFSQGVIRAFDATTGAAQPGRDIPLAKPVGLALRRDGALLAVSGKQVVAVDLATRAVQPLVASGLAAPFGLAVGRDGAIYVSDWRDSFQVKVFSAEGRPLRAIGRPGGRAVLGKWEKDGMLLPRGIAVTDAGRLWVAEDDTTPRRVSVWDAASGALVRDYIGPTPYGGGSSFWFEPGDPTVLHTMGCRFKLDWEKKTWTPEASELRRMSHDQPFALCGANGMQHGVRTYRRAGRDYAAVPASYDTITILRRDGEAWRPVAAVGTLHRWVSGDGAGASIWDSDVGRHLIPDFRPDCFRGHSGENFAWSDRNDDGRVQAEELTWRKVSFRNEAWVAPDGQPEFVTGWGHASDPELNLYLGGNCKLDGGNDRVVCRLRPSGWTDAGVPLYDIDKAEVFALTRGVNGLYAGRNGQVYAAGAEHSSEDAITCFDRSGKKLWRIAGRINPRADDVAASNVIGEFDLPGIGGVIGTWAWHGNFRPYLVSDDGLYIGTLLDDTKFGPKALWDESWRFYYQAPDGTPYLINGANDAQHILRITGLEQAGRFAGTLAISEAEAALAAAARPAGTAEAAPRQPLAVAWRAVAPEIDGSLADWDAAYGTRIALAKGAAANAMLARDADTLYLAWQVEDDSPLKNLGGNWQTLFLTGDCVDLMLAADPRAAAGRTAAAAGDLRLLLSVFQDKPVAVLYRPLVPGTAKPVQLMAARIDRIDLLDQARVAVRRDGGSYAIEAAVPLAALGLDGAALDRLRGDVGVVSSDLAGRDRVKRSYHFNQHTAMTADLTTEATLTPAEWGPVQFPLGANLLRDGGFENGLATRPADGWAVVKLGDGMKATTSTDAAHSGARGLHIRQTAPVAGDGAVVAQRVPVRAGATYRLRAFLRGSGLGGGNAGQVSITWLDAGGEVVAGGLAADAAWAAVASDRPLAAPAGASAALVAVRVAVAAPASLPAVAVDDVEFAEVR